MILHPNFSGDFQGGGGAIPDAPIAAPTPADSAIGMSAEDIGFLLNSDSEPATSTPAAITPSSPPSQPVAPVVEPSPDPLVVAGITEDPWADFDATGLPGAAGDALLTAPLAELATVLGAESIPDTTAGWQELIEQEVSRRVTVAEDSAIRQLDALDNMSDVDRVRQYFYENRGLLDTDEIIESRVDEYEAQGGIEQASATLRQLDNQHRQREELRLETGIAEKRQQMVQARQDAVDALQLFKDPGGRALPAKIQSELSNYFQSRAYAEAWASQGLDYHIERALELNPRTSSIYKTLRQNLSEMKGASGVYKELEHQSPSVGGGATAMQQSVRLLSNDDLDRFSIN